MGHSFNKSHAVLVTYLGLMQQSSPPPSPLTSQRAVAPARSVVGMVITAADVYQTIPPTAITKFSLGLVSFISLLEQMKLTHMAVGKYHNTN